MTPAGSSISFREAFRFWLKLGFINFGGPAGQIAIMHRELVERKKWISEEQFLRALNFCMLLPGPEAQQLATYIGARLHGARGGIVAGTFFVLPSVFVLLLLSWLAVRHAEVPAIAAMFYGIQCAVVGIVAEAVLRIGRRALRHRALLLFAAGAFAALYVFNVDFPWIVLAAGLIGALLERRWPEIFAPSSSGDAGTHGAVNSPAGAGEHAPASAAANLHGAPSLGRVLRVALVCLLLWAIPVGAIVITRGTDDVLFQQAMFFTRAAFVTFGGAYAVLSYVADVAVNDYRWLTAPQMVQGLGLAESTPGPLIMVLQYVGFVGAWNHAGSHPPLVNAVFGALIATYCTFLPSFFFIFAGAPYIESLAHNRRLQAALAGITAAIVGVILNLAVFFGSRVLLRAGGGVDWFAAAIATISFVLLLRTKVPVYVLVPAAALTGVLWKLL